MTRLGVHGTGDIGIWLDCSHLRDASVTRGDMPQPWLPGWVEARISRLSQLDFRIPNVAVMRLIADLIPHHLEPPTLTGLRERGADHGVDLLQFGFRGELLQPLIWVQRVRAQERC